MSPRSALEKMAPPLGIVSTLLGGGDIAVVMQGDKLMVVAGTTAATDGSKTVALVSLTAQWAQHCCPLLRAAPPVLTASQKVDNS